jgi:MoxR-like ATPase
MNKKPKKSPQGRHSPAPAIERDREKLAPSPQLVGRSDELDKIRACVVAGRNILLEGPVGVGKTHLALAVTRELRRPVFRVDGDSRYSEQKLSGWFDPPLVLKHGYSARSFVPGPLVEAMKSGGVLFINELNRLPEGVQNILLPAIDERVVVVPRLGEVRAIDGFCVIATQNPKEFVATSHLSEAILDRFELVVLAYQTEDEELEIVSRSCSHELLSRAAVRLARLTRSHPRVRRGASVRAAQSIAEIGDAILRSQGRELREAFLWAALLALPTRIEIERDAESSSSLQAEVRALVEGWVSEVLESLGQVGVEKKKN